MLRTVWSGVLDLLSPPHCAGCSFPMAGHESGASFCAACGPLVERAPHPWQPPAPDAAALAFQGPVADAIRRFKYARRVSIAKPLGELLADAALPFAGSIESVVPVPLHPRKLRERGWNPSLLLARPVARALGAALRPHWLVRVRATRVQAGLCRDDRQRNVAGAFRAQPVQELAGRAGARVLLIDDVRTTGATLAEAARTLREAGYSVATLALAWAPEDAF